jgi:hypothetical protein
VISNSYHFFEDVPEEGMMTGDSPMRGVASVEHRRARLFARIRIGIGVWLLILTAILYGYDRGGRWRALLIPTAAVLFYAAYRLRRTISARTNSRDAK